MYMEQLVRRPRRGGVAQLACRGPGLTPAAARRALQQDIANPKRRTLDGELDDLASVRGCCGSAARAGHAPVLTTALPASRQFDGAEGDLLGAVRGNTRRYLQLFAEAADDVMPVPTELHEEDDVFDVLMRQARALCCRCCTPGAMR